MFSLSDVFWGFSRFFWCYFTDVSAYKAQMDSAYGAVKQSLKLTEAETPIFKQLDIDVID